jgi:hypothetical protein
MDQDSVGRRVGDRIIRNGGLLSISSHKCGGEQSILVKRVDFDE